ncbi:MAG TPA: diguanylate cyclase [Candidatus Baltobacteraceae bacterium]|jgi:diguanylate cyclase (GGDEF)-like protein
MGRVFTAFVLFVFLGCGAVRAESPWATIADPVFTRIEAQGLPQPAVYAVAQDEAGFLWVGTPGGLARYDGYAFVPFTPGAGYAAAPAGVEALLADGPRLWIGTASNGLTSLDETSGTFTNWAPDGKGVRGPRSSAVIALARVGSRLWIGGDAGLDSFDPQSGVFACEPLGSGGEGDRRVEAIRTDRNGAIWVATVRGLFYRPAGARTFRRFVTNAGERNNPGTFFSLYEDVRGRMWAGAVNAVYAIAADRRSVTTYASNGDASLAPGEQWTLIEATPGKIWAGTGGAISIIDAAASRVHRVTVDRANPSGYMPGDVWQFVRDRSGLIWIANGPGGLLAHNPLNRGIYELSSSDILGVGNLGVRAVAAGRDGALWAGGSHDVVRFDPRSGAGGALSVPDRPSISALAQSNGTLLIGTIAGVCRLQAAQAAIECPSGEYQQVRRSFSLLQDGDRLWAGSSSGVTEWDQRSGKVTRFRRGSGPRSISNDFVTVLYEDIDGRIWAGTANGLNRIDPETGLVTRFVHDDGNLGSLGAGTMSSLAEDQSRRIWAGAIGGPLNVLTEWSDGSMTVRHMDQSDGVPGNVDGLTVDANGTVWASAPGSMVRIDPQRMRGLPLGPPVSIAESEFWSRSVARANDGTSFFAGMYAVTIVTPNASATWHYAPPVAITALRTGDRTVPVWSQTTDVRLEPGARDLTVEFAALDYSAPQLLHYSYLLKGYNSDWIDANSSHRVATYTNLAPGEYTLLVRATNRSGEWSPNVVALHVRAMPAWFETWWFKLFAAALFIAAIVAFVRGRTAILRSRAERFEAIVERRTFELAQANTALERMTITDTLTGLFNRRFLVQRIDEDVALALRQKTDLVFFIVDVDHFKAVNDELGHAAGDRVLAQMRDRLESVFRSSDYVVRWGGEEFLAVTRATSRNDAPEIAERLREAIARTPFSIGGGQWLLKTVSIGFAAFPFVETEPVALSWEQVVALADRALYMAKDAGRNAWFGLSSGEKTDPGQVASVLTHSPEAVAETCGLIAVTSTRVPSV